MKSPPLDPLSQSISGPRGTFTLQPGLCRCRNGWQARRTGDVGSRDGVRDNEKGWYDWKT